MRKEVQEIKSEETPHGYLECVAPNCQYFGLVKIPQEKWNRWGEGSSDSTALERLITAECPGCGSTRVVKSATDIAPDVTDPIKLKEWLRSHTKEPNISYAHLHPDEQIDNTIKQAELLVEGALENKEPVYKIQKSLVDFTSREYPMIPISKHK